MFQVLAQVLAVAQAGVLAQALAEVLAQDLAEVLALAEVAPDLYVRSAVSQYGLYTGLSID